MHPLTKLLETSLIDDEITMRVDKIIRDYLKSRIEWVKNRKSSSVSFIDMLELSVEEKCGLCDQPHKHVHTDGKT